MSCFVLNVQMAVPPRVKRMFGAAEVAAFIGKKPTRCLTPIKRFLDRTRYRSSAWLAGSPAAEIVLAARREHRELIVLGTHGHGIIGRALMGSAGTASGGRCRRSPSLLRVKLIAADGAAYHDPWLMDAAVVAAAWA